MTDGRDEGRVSSIWKRRHVVEAARRVKLREAMQEYDETVFYPALHALRTECAAEGHERGKHHNNGLGYNWFWCNKCGGRMDITDIEGNQIHD